MTEWITDRQPTKADEDKDGEVLMLCFPDGRNSCGGARDALVAAAHVGPGVPWMRTNIWRPLAQPAPEAKAAAPEPIYAEPTPTIKIPEPIRTGAAPFYVVVVSDDMGGKPGGNPIVWEHTIPKTTTLQAALRQQQRIDSRYGTTYVAECRIIPELTRHAA